MEAKILEKEKAINLRKKGRTYSEILREVPVAKSTLSLWLRDVGMAKRQKQRITGKRIAAQKKGSAVRKQARRRETKKIYELAAKEVRALSQRERWLIGVALYWGEGAKEKEKSIAQGIDFGNTDPEMIRFFIDWLQEFLGVDSGDINYSLYIHEQSRHRIDEVKRFWKKASGDKSMKLSYIYFKNHNPKTKRHNTGQSYFGTLRIRVRRSTAQQRKISGWVYGITGAPCQVV